MDYELRWKQRFSNFQNAYSTFLRVLERLDANPEDEIVKMALIQSFEFTYELAWKTMKDYLESEGFDQVQSSKQTIRTAFQAELIDNPEGWMNAVEKRNLVSHTYENSLLEEAIIFIRQEFFPLAGKLHEDLKSRL